MNNGEILLVELKPYTTNNGSNEVFIKLTVNQIGVSLDEVKEKLTENDFKQLKNLKDEY